MDIDADTVNALADKIDSLGLTEAETAVLEEVFARAASAESEVEGFAWVPPSGQAGMGVDPRRFDAASLRSVTAGRLAGGLGILVGQIPPVS